MSTGYRLRTLDCSQCGAPLAAEEDDVVYYCTACYSGFRLDPRAEELKPVEVSFVALAGTSAARYSPFWLLPAHVSITARDATGGFSRSVASSLARFFLGDREQTGHPAGEGTFVIPAFDTPLTRATALAARYTAEFPRLDEKLGERLTGGLYSPEDAQTLAHFTLIAAEAEKPDTLRNLAYEIRFGEPSLLGVPFSPAGAGWVDAIFRLPG